MMGTPNEGTAAALDLAEVAVNLLAMFGDRPGSLRLKHTIAIIKNDGKYPALGDMDVPLALMQMAIALIDRNYPNSAVACRLQAAIDSVPAAEIKAECQAFDRNLYPFVPTSRRLT